MGKMKRLSKVKVVVSPESFQGKEYEKIRKPREAAEIAGG